MNCDCNLPDYYCLEHKSRHADCPDVDHLDFALIPPDAIKAANPSESRS
jgi:hypothetical protein